MFKRNLKKQNKLLRIFLKIFKIYAINKENFNFVNPKVNNKGKNFFKFNDKSFNLSSGYTEITRGVKKLDIIYRYCPSKSLWNSTDTWKRIIPNINKEILIKTCLNSLKNSILHFLNKNNQLDITLHLIKDQSNQNFDDEISKIIKNDHFEFNFHDSKIPGNHGSFIECCDIAEKLSHDLIFFIEDDYLFESNAIEEMILSYSKISSIINEEIFMCPTDYPFYYDSNYQTSLIMGNANRWRYIGETLLTFLMSKKIFLENLEKIKEIGKNQNDPFEKPLHELYEKIPCFAPIGTLAHHISRGIPSLNENWLELWEKNLIKN